MAVVMAAPNRKKGAAGLREGQLPRSPPNSGETSSEASTGSSDAARRRQVARKLRAQRFILLSQSFTIHADAHAFKLFNHSLVTNKRKPCLVVTRLKAQSGLSAGFASMRLTDDGSKLLTTPNAGGTSVRSEAMSIEFLQRAFGATLCASEMEVQYWPPNGPITDYVATLNGEHIGVSVTRAFHFKGPQFYKAGDAARLLRKKLQGVINSTKTVLYPEFKRQILHVWCESDAIARHVALEYQSLKAHHRSNTIVVLTVCQARWLYDETQTSNPEKVKKVRKKKPKPATPTEQPTRKTRKRRRKQRMQRSLLRLAYDATISVISAVSTLCSSAAWFMFST